MPPRRHGGRPRQAQKVLGGSHLPIFGTRGIGVAHPAPGLCANPRSKGRSRWRGSAFTQASKRRSPCLRRPRTLASCSGPVTTGSPAPESVVNSHYATTIGKNGTRVGTVEHLMAAAAGLGIDNLEVRVDGPEIPAMDGSAKPFVALLAAAGRNPQSARRRSLTLPNPIRVGSDGRWIHIFPAPAFRISYTLDVDHPAIGTQVLSWAP